MAVALLIQGHVLILCMRYCNQYFNNCPTTCNTKQSIYYSASSFYAFRVSTTPIIRSTQNCNYSLRHWSYFLCSCLPPTWPCNTKQSIYYSASSLYMFRVSITPIIRSTQNCNYSLRYRSYFCATRTSSLIPDA